jgi:hypothetical protein
VGCSPRGNIGAARIVLERTAENGNARASFMLAETYVPVILSLGAYAYDEDRLIDACARHGGLYDGVA